MKNELGFWFSFNKGVDPINPLDPIGHPPPDCWNEPISTLTVSEWADCYEWNLREVKRIEVINFLATLNTFVVSDITYLILFVLMDRRRSSRIRD